MIVLSDIKKQSMTGITKMDMIFKKKIEFAISEFLVEAIGDFHKTDNVMVIKLLESFEKQGLEIIERND